MSLPTLAFHGPTNPPKSAGGVRRYGSVIGLDPAMEDAYRRLHANVWPTVLNRLHHSSVRNYSIFIADLAGHKYLFSYLEYVGDDFATDMRKIAEDPVTRKWWLHTDPCQRRLPRTPDGEQWLRLESVFSAELKTIIEAQ